MNKRKDKKRAGKDLGITIIDTQSLISVSQSRPPLLAEDNLVSVGSPKNEQLQILLGPDAFSTIDPHATSDLSREVGGFLVGRPYEWQGQMYLEIVDALPSKRVSSSAVHFTFSSETWGQAQTTVREEFGDMHIVGWYHTHPRMHVFMSAQDIDIHQGFFREPWHVSLVIEPSRREAGFFVWDKNRIQPADGYYIDYPADTAQEKLWQVPSEPVPPDLDARPLTLDEFYEVGGWRTRWTEQDEIAVKIRQEAMSHLNEDAASHLGPLFGLCRGRIYSNRSTEIPRSFIEVTEIQPILDERLTAKSGMEVMAKMMGEISHAFVEDRNRQQRVVGWYWIGPKPSSHPLFNDLYKKLGSFIGEISLIGNAERGIENCSWQQANGEFVTRPLVEIVALEELSGDGLEKTLATIRDAGQEMLSDSMTGSDISTIDKDEVNLQ